MEPNLSKLADVNDVNSNVVNVRVDEKKVNDDVYKRLNKIEEELYLLNQYSRKNNIIITGVPFNEKENIDDIVYQVGSALNVEINRWDVYIAHRLPAERQKNYPPAIIVRLNNGIVKKNMLENAKRNKISSRQLKLTNCYKDYPLDYPIRIKEHLSSESQEVYSRVQQLKNEGKIEDCWCVDGVTGLRLNTSDTCKKILGLGHLSRYIEEHLGTAMSSLELSDSKSSNINNIRNSSICSENKQSTSSESEVFDDNSNKPEENETYLMGVNRERSMVNSEELKQGESTQKTSSPVIFGKMYSDMADFNNNYKEPKLTEKKSKRGLNSITNTKSYTQDVELQHNANKDLDNTDKNASSVMKDLNLVESRTQGYNTRSNLEYDRKTQPKKYIPTQHRKPYPRREN